MNEYIEYIFENKRLPEKLRKDKVLAKSLCEYILKYNIDVKNKDIFILANWVGLDLIKKKNKDLYSNILSIKILDQEEMVGDITVPIGNSYCVNGMILHNCNLPENVTKETVSDVYMRAWESGCKGFTVYRDKCRTGVLIAIEDKKEKKSLLDRPDHIELSMAPKRPLELNCEIKKVKVSGENWTIFIGMLDNKPYELFGGLSKYVDIPNKNKIGKILKNGKNSDGVTSYNLVIGEDDDQMLIKDIANVFDNANFGAFTRTISLALRHGTPVQYVCEQLLKDKHSDITSFAKVIARVLKSYIVDGTKATQKTCPECKAEDSLIYEEKCLKCSSCRLAANVNCIRQFICIKIRDYESHNSFKL